MAALCCGHRDHRRRRPVRGRAVVAGHGADGAAGLPLPAARAGHRDGGRRHHRFPDRRHGRLHDRRQLRLYRRADRHRQAPRPRHPDRLRGLARRRCDVRRVRGVRAGDPGAAAPPDLRLGDRQRQRPRRGDRPHPGHGGPGRTTQTRFRHGAAALAVSVLRLVGVVHRDRQPYRLVGAVAGDGAAARDSRCAQAGALDRHRDHRAGARPAARRPLPLSQRRPRRARPGVARLWNPASTSPSPAPTARARRR